MSSFPKDELLPKRTIQATSFIEATGCDGDVTVAANSLTALTSCRLQDKASLLQSSILASTQGLQDCRRVKLLNGENRKHLI